MIDLYYFPTPNAWKIAIMLDECALPYRVVPIDITNGEQFRPDFLAISPNNRIPAIVDHDGLEGPQSVFESGAILIYLAEKTGRFLARSGRDRVTALEWVFWQMSGLGPMAGQVHHFLRFQPDNVYAIERYTREATRLYGVLDRHLYDRAWIAGDYGIADMACWGWIWYHRMHRQTLTDFPNTSRWFAAMSARPAVAQVRRIGLEHVADDIRQMYATSHWMPPEERGAWTAQTA
jgi:GST-like protein